MMKTLDDIIETIEKKYEDKIEAGARHYVEVDIGDQAERLGFNDLARKYRKINAILPLKEPLDGMKVRIDGRTFVDYAQFGSGVAIPGRIARDVSRSFKTFVPNDSMICNYRQLN